MQNHDFSFVFTYAVCRFRYAIILATSSNAKSDLALIKVMDKDRFDATIAKETELL